MRRRSLLLWLLKKLNCHSIAPINWITITADASSKGWSAHCLSEIAQGQWSFPSQGVVTHVLELRAAFGTLLAFHHLTIGASVLLRLDNTTAISYIKRQGETRSLNLLKEEELIMLWAQKNLSNISTVYVPGA